MNTESILVTAAARREDLRVRIREIEAYSKPPRGNQLSEELSLLLELDLLYSVIEVIGKDVVGLKNTSYNPHMVKTLE